MKQNLLKLTCMTGILVQSTLTLVVAQELTIPPPGYTDVIKRSDFVKRQNSQFPLSDQTNKGKWTLNQQFTDEFDSPELNTKRWHPTNPSWKGRPPTFFMLPILSLKMVN
ncbi:hypothetical protein RS130_21655 [Paraglaciecola aquimarina]|uniref:Uncharacterized protein n=1 Tax=Paraglaciecola aquimarina TaxID=1235557 RepID=A0ABU3T1P3_9ALTE|nr:hypothetical protein [Paraglaciecola aquimarina]MDU0356147.1 hypothetical protein [Paraglaciecola aquimarina]